MLPLKLQVVLFITSAVGVFILIFLLRKNILSLKYSLIWLAVGVLSLILSIFPSVFCFISRIIGVETPANALFLFGFYFVLCILFSLTVISSRNALRVKILNQEIALLKHELEKRNFHE